jgi:hypothetical protein
MEEELEITPLELLRLIYQAGFSEGMIFFTLESRASMGFVLNMNLQV